MFWFSDVDWSDLKKNNNNNRKQQKKPLILKIYTTGRLYELPSIIQEVLFSINPLLNLFCGDGRTKP